MEFKKVSNNYVIDEAEYVIVTSTACQAKSLRRLLKDLHQEQKEATKIFCDSKAIIAMTKNLTFHGRAKHIERRYYFIRDLVANGAIAMKYCGTDKQVIDILTKSFPVQKHIYFMSQIDVYNMNQGRVLRIDS